MSITDDNTINVSPARLRETAGQFKKASLDTFDLLNELQGTAKQLVGEMYAELHQSPAALERLCDRWSIATDDLGAALRDVANNLAAASDTYEQTETQIKGSFQKS
jgi:uncharacterized protein YukE